MPQVPAYLLPNLQSDVRSASDLQKLRVALEAAREIADTFSARLEDIIDLRAVPKFGGETPTVPGVVSWSPAELLGRNAQGVFVIVRR